MAKQTEAQMLREYLKIKNARAKTFCSQLRDLIHKSDLTLNETKPFFKLIEEYEQQSIQS